MVVLQGVGQCDDLSLGVGAVLLRAKLRSDRLYVIRGFLVCVASCAKQAQKKAECNDPTEHLLLIFFLKQVSVCFCFVLLSKFFGKSNNNIGNDKSKIVKTGLARGGSPTYVAGFVESGVDAKYAIEDGLVYVNGEQAFQRGKKLVDGDIVTYEGQTIKIIK